MPVLNSLTAALAFVGRHGTIAVALSIMCGVVLPSLAALSKPLLGPTIIGLLTLAFLRVELAALSALARRPALSLATAAWVMVVLPVALGALFNATGLAVSLPDLYFMLILQACAPGLMSAPALAGLVGLDVALTLAGLVLSMVLAPLVAGLLTHVFLGTAVIAPLGLAVRLSLLIAGSAAVAAVIRRLAGSERIKRSHEVIDGLSVVGMFIFAIAAMDGVAAHFIAAPAFVSALTALAFALSIGTLVLTSLVFLPAGRERAFAVGLLAANRNVGLMLTATGFAVPELAWLYFGLAQFPIYLMPAALKPLAARLTKSR
jgi:BASS family bile acid:Na+ symporter